MIQLWAPKWSQTSKLDGHRENLIWHDLMPAIFRSRRECREFIEREFGYIRHRDDLRREPHCWRMPRAVKVEVTEVGKPRRGGRVGGSRDA